SLVSNGTLTGEPQYDGTWNFRVGVTDSTGSTITSPIYSLAVFSAGALAVASTTLDPASLGQTYTEMLHAAGGTPPLFWSLLDGVSEPVYPGEPNENLGTSLLALGLNFYPRS